MEGGANMNIFQSIGLTEWLIIAVIIIILFGGKKIPELFKGVAEAMREFKRSSKEPEHKEG